MEGGNKHESVVKVGTGFRGRKEKLLQSPAR